MDVRSRFITALACLATFAGGLTRQSANNERHASDQAVKVVERKAQAYARANKQRTIYACQRGNVSRSNKINDSSDPDDQPDELAHQYTTEPILNCQATANNKGLEIPLSTVEAKKYITLIDQERMPLIQNGRVVDSKPFVRVQ